MLGDLGAGDMLGDLGVGDTTRPREQTAALLGRNAGSPLAAESIEQRSGNIGR
jgi:hypothetical protein